MTDTLPELPVKLPLVGTLVSVTSLAPVPLNELLIVGSVPLADTLVELPLNDALPGICESVTSLAPVPVNVGAVAE